MTEPTYKMVRNLDGSDYGGAVDGGGGGGDDSGMDARLKAIELVIPTLATKSDVAEIRLATKADMADIRADLHKMDASIVRWMIATVIGLFLGFAGLFFTMTNATRTTSSPAPPIIINVPGATAAPPATSSPTP